MLSLYAIAVLSALSNDLYSEHCAACLPRVDPNEPHAFRVFRYQACNLVLARPILPFAEWHPAAAAAAESGERTGEGACAAEAGWASLSGRPQAAA